MTFDAVVTIGELIQPLLKFIVWAVIIGCAWNLGKLVFHPGADGLSEYVPRIVALISIAAIAGGIDIIASWIISDFSGGQEFTRILAYL